MLGLNNRSVSPLERKAVEALPRKISEGARAGGAVGGWPGLGKLSSKLSTFRSSIVATGWESLVVCLW